ncbi:DNA-packaging protein [Alteriqipengyuania lutimaris]|uniref:ATP-binding protein n=1 Tax=Alteriqipengyuania lutimaris TaxID=1538146 RepID=A0A395LHY9_9SPHN|nr:terminase family protein [Alteriqipengyuania lutimaris]MBB3034549.1 phage terminase large subunit-like protein [Alteriqipengyuania lutimaris]RDS76566.1 ATP-binding protein [Alteriqipengyuania lutimaris]
MKPDRLDALAKLSDAARGDWYASLTEEEADALGLRWPLWARPEQLPPTSDWHIWLICAGRGFGKTRAGAEWVRAIARSDRHARIALVGASLAEVRNVMIEGESGILAVCAPNHAPVWEPSLRRLTWPGGARGYCYSAAEPESLRGPQHSHAWCDEIAKWDNAGERATAAWDNLQMGLRLGDWPRAMATTTPRAVPLVRRLLENGETRDVAVTRGTTWDNESNLPSRFVERMRRQFGSTTLGRQELDGELLTDVEGALWSRALIEMCRTAPPLHRRGSEGGNEALARIVIGVDPPASAQGDACGIVVCGVDGEGFATVLADASVERASPETWARAVARAAERWAADRVIAEANQGGAMVESVLRAADVSLPVKLVHASRGKAARAEPVAALYEAGRVRHAGLFAKLEDQLCGLTIGGGYEGPGRSPDRADALVWALTELMLGRGGRPRVRTP